MRTLAITLAVSILATSPVASLAADQPPDLAHNPFSRPPSAVIRPLRPIVENEDGTEPGLPLLATMVGHVNRLANVGGRIMKAGDDYEGYRLLAIYEDHAVFERNGQRTSVYVRTALSDDRSSDRTRR